MREPSPVIKQVTIADVARQAGVSTGTVSLALNGSTRCSRTTAARVRAAAQALNYLPNHAAKSLRRQVSETVALVIPDIGNPVYVMMAQAVQKVVKARGYHLTLISTDGVPNEEVHAVQSLARQSVDGLILCSLRMTPGLLESLEAASRIVCVIGQVPQSAQVNNVGVDSQYGVTLALDHLWAQGRRTVAIINGPHDTAPAKARLSGYQKALRVQGWPVEPSLMINTVFSAAGGQDGVAELWSGRSDIDAIFCANDSIAIGAMQALRRRGVRVPDDVAVIGMDNIPECTLCTPTLTSVSLEAAERARIAAELVFESFGGAQRSAAQRLMVAPRLIVRESSTELLSLANA